MDAVSSFSGKGCQHKAASPTCSRSMKTFSRSLDGSSQHCDSFFQSHAPDFCNTRTTDTPPESSTAVRISIPTGKKSTLVGRPDSLSSFNQQSPRVKRGQNMNWIQQKTNTLTNSKTVAK